LYLRGEFDIYNKRQLAETLASSVEYRTITVDLAQAPIHRRRHCRRFCPVATLRLELDAAKLRIVNVNSFTFKLFSICGLDAIFCIEQQRDA